MFKDKAKVEEQSAQTQPEREPSEFDDAKASSCQGTSFGYSVEARSAYTEAQTICGVAELREALAEMVEHAPSELGGYLDAAIARAKTVLAQGTSEPTA